MSIELKVKSKHLSEEARIIRFEENKLKRQKEWLKTHQQPYAKVADQWFSLNQHRRKDVRNENRATFIARAYLDGKEYNSVEQKRKLDNEYEFQTKIKPRALKLINKYGNKVVTEKEFDLWLN